MMIFITLVPVFQVWCNGYICMTFDVFCFLNLYCVFPVLCSYGQHVLWSSGIPFHYKKAELLQFWSSAVAQQMFFNIDYQEMKPKKRGRRDTRIFICQWHVTFKCKQDYIYTWLSAKRCTNGGSDFWLSIKSVSNTLSCCCFVRVFIIGQYHSGNNMSSKSGAAEKILFSESEKRHEI